MDTSVSDFNALLRNGEPSPGSFLEPPHHGSRQRHWSYPCSQRMASCLQSQCFGEMDARGLACPHLNKGSVSAGRRRAGVLALRHRHSQRRPHRWKSVPYLRRSRAAKSRLRTDCRRGGRPCQGFRDAGYCAPSHESVRTIYAH